MLPPSAPTTKPVRRSSRRQALQSRLRGYRTKFRNPNTSEETESFTRQECIKVALLCLVKNIWTQVCRLLERWHGSTFTLIGVPRPFIRHANKQLRYFDEFDKLEEAEEERLRDLPPRIRVVGREKGIRRQIACLKRLWWELESMRNELWREIGLWDEFFPNGQPSADEKEEVKRVLTRLLLYATS